MSARTRSAKVVVIGGGLAGLAATVALADAGCEVELVESRPLLGGRATSFLDAETGERVDNCQHVTMGCCTNLADFCRRVDIQHLVQSEPVLYFQDEAGRVSEMKASRLPPPLHLAPSFLKANFITMPEKLRIAYGMWQLLRQPTVAPDMDFGTWLDRHGQTQRTKDRYWGLVLTSALNDTLENIAYPYARQVFLEGFLASAQASLVEIPQVPLADFYGAPLDRWLARHEVTVHRNVAALQLQLRDQRIACCPLKSGQLLEADHYILAVPYHRVRDLMPPVAHNRTEAWSRIDELEHSPITSIHLWYDRPVMQQPHLVPVGRTAQWIFRRPSAGEESYLQVVVSAARMFTGMRRAQIFEVIEQELREILPETRSATVKHYRVVTERMATYGMKPDIDAYRPPQETSIENLWLAGDYTQTGWPATMEGAVRSGYLTAEKILAKLQMPTHLLKGPLPPGRLVRWLAR